MSTEPSREVAQALDDGELDSLTPMGSCKAQESGGSVYSLIPPKLAQAHSINQGTDLELAYHAPTGTLLVSLEGPIFPSE